MEECKDEIKTRWERVREITELLGESYRNPEGHGLLKEEEKK